MTDISLTLTAITHVVYAGLRSITPDALLDTDRETRDRGAVSLEQALWYAAAATAVGIVATVIWTKIKSEADKPVVPGGL
jgi:hypothetical protein